MNTYRKTAMALAISGATIMTSGLAQADGEGWMIGGGAYYSDIDDKLNVDRDDFDRERFSFNSSSASLRRAFSCSMSSSMRSWIPCNTSSSARSRSPATAPRG